MNRVSAFNYVFGNLYLKCLNCDAYYRLQTFLKAPFVFNKSCIKFYSTVGQHAINYNFVGESSENGVLPCSKENIEGSEKLKKSISDPSVEFKSFNTIEYIRSLQILENVKDVLLSAFQEKEKGIYLVDQEIAKDLANVFLSELKRTDSIVIEGNPGLGYLTRQLLEAGIPYIRCFESNKCFFKYLKNENFPWKVDIYSKDIVRFWKMQFIDRKDGGSRMSNLFYGVSKKNWEEEPVVKVVAPLPDAKFIFGIIDNIVTQTGFVKYGRPEFYLVLDPISYYCLSNSGNRDYANYRPHSVLFQLMFDYKVLGKVPRKVFLPWGKQKKRLSPHQKKLLEKDGAVMYAIKLTPHKDLYANNFDGKFVAFQYFLKQIFSARKKRILPKLEEWAPGIGPSMIAKGYDIYTEVGELSPQEIKNIFIIFLSWDESVENSSFFASLEAYLLKKHDPDDVLEDEAQ